MESNHLELTKGEAQVASALHRRNGSVNKKSQSGGTLIADLPNIPAYDELPPVPGLPHGCTWGLWDKLLGLTASSPDQLGTLNLLTPTTVLAARDEVQAGISVALNWSMDNCQTPHSGRRAPEHRIFTLEEGGGQWTGHDDEVHYNTQGGSQWDGFRERSWL